MKFLIAMMVVSFSLTACEKGSDSEAKAEEVENLQGAASKPQVVIVPKFSNDGMSFVKSNGTNGDREPHTEGNDHFRPHDGPNSEHVVKSPALRRLMNESGKPSISPKK